LLVGEEHNALTKITRVAAAASHPLPLSLTKVNAVVDPDTHYLDG